MPNQEAASPAERTMSRWVRGQHDRQYQPTIVMLIEKGCRQEREIIAQVERSQGQRQVAVATDPGPERGVLRVFALARVVTDEIELKVVVVAEIARVQVY